MDQQQQFLQHQANLVGQQHQQHQQQHHFEQHLRGDSMFACGLATATGSRGRHQELAGAKSKKKKAR